MVTMKQEITISSLLCGLVLVCFPHQAQTNRIYGGSDAGPSEFPSFVFPQGQTFTCGATLIHEDIAITVAHCLDGLTSFVNQRLLSFGSSSNTVSIGGNQKDGSNAVDFRKVVIERQHPDYNSDSVVADVAVLKLDSPSSAPPVQFNEEPSDPSTGASMVTVGYGVTELGDFPGVLQKVTVDVVDSSICTTQLAPYYDDSKMLCAGGSGVDSCAGDSGGPLYDGGTIVGLTSWGNGCAVTPGVYTRVSTYAPFIQRAICELSANPPTNGDCDDVMMGESSQTCDRCPGFIFAGERLRVSLFGGCTEACFPLPFIFKLFGLATCGYCE